MRNCYTQQASWLCLLQQMLRHAWLKQTEAWITFFTNYKCNIRTQPQQTYGILRHNYGRNTHSLKLPFQDGNKKWHGLQADWEFKKQKLIKKDYLQGKYIQTNSCDRDGKMYPHISLFCYISRDDNRIESTGWKTWQVTNRWSDLSMRLLGALWHTQHV